jgi:hypothetical protein
MNHISLKARLEKYLLKNHGWIAKATLCDLARENVGATGEHTGRRLRELEVEGVLEVQYRKGHAFYRIKVVETPEELNRRQLEWFNELPTTCEERVKLRAFV